MSETQQQFNSMAEFYPYYLQEHSNPVCRVLHFIGSTIALILLASAFVLDNYWLLLVGFVQGYAWAWIGHFVFEKNKPATFVYPFYSFAGDWLMYRDMLLGRISWVR